MKLNLNLLTKKDRNIMRATNNISFVIGSALCVLLCILGPTIAATQRTGLVAEGSTLTLDGKPFQIFSGSIHYWRVPAEYWLDRLQKFKAAGLNSVTIYTAWNLHEPQKGHYDFSDRLDIVKFLQTAQQVGLYVILRPGPFICGEFEYGGMPYWLLNDENMKVRTMYAGYTHAVELWLAKLIPMISQFQYTKGGNIIAVQVANEYGAYGNSQDYLRWLRNVLASNGIQELFFKSDGWEFISLDSLPGLYTVINFQTNVALNRRVLGTLQPKRPQMVGEFWVGWYDHWGDKSHHIWSSDRMNANLQQILAANMSVSMYMFIGGTNFDFTNGANRLYGVFRTKPAYIPQCTSYDYDAPLTEAGRTTTKYFAVQKAMQQYNPNFKLTPELAKLAEDARIDENAPGKLIWGSFDSVQSLGLLDFMKSVTPKTALNLINMETFFQSYGYIAYRQNIRHAGQLKFSVDVADRLQVILNGNVVKTLESLTNENDHFEFTLNAAAGSDLILLAENLGRVNYEIKPFGELNNERKGLGGTVTANGQTLQDWQVYTLDFQNGQFQSVQNSQAWRPIAFAPSLQTQPTFYRIDLSSTNFPKTPSDAFLIFDGWSKGVAWMNGRNLGRYWPTKGPLRSLYVPGVYMKNAPTKNELILFELEKPSSSIAFSDKPDYGPKTCNMPDCNPL